jgi:hypothetical protein
MTYYEPADSISDLRIIAERRALMAYDVHSKPFIQQSPENADIFQICCIGNDGTVKVLIEMTSDLYPI